MKNYKKNRNSTSFRAAYISMVSALAVAIMLVGTFLEIADLASAMVASFLVWFISIEFGISSSLSCYAVISLLSFFTLPSKLPTFYFVILYGWYPSINHILHIKVRIKWVRFAAKTVFTVICVILEEFLARNLLGYIQSRIMTAVIIIVSLLIYIPYDVLLSKFGILYIKKWRKYIFRHY